MTSARRTLLAAVGVAGVALAVGVVVGLAPASLVGAASGLDATLATGVVGAGLVGYAFHRRRKSRPSTDSRLLADAESDADAADPGQPVDDALDRITDYGNATFTEEARSRVRSRVRETAVRAYARSTGVPEADAEDAVATGAWTGDAVAAAFVGDERAPRYPLRERLRGWVHPGRAFRRRATRAADAAHDLATGSSTAHDTRAGTDAATDLAADRTDDAHAGGPTEGST